MGDNVSEALASLKIDRSTPPKKTIPKWLPWGIGLVLLVFLLPLGKSALSAMFFATEVSFTEISWVSPVEGAVKLTATGYAIPQKTSKVGAKIPGRIKTVHVEEGQRVEVGAPLVSLEASDREAARAALEANWAEARAREQTARAKLLEISARAKRQRILVERGAAGRATSTDLDAQEASAIASVKAAASSVAAKKAQLARAETELSYLEIVAPIGGTVVTKPPASGEMANSAEPVLEIADYQSTVIEVDVPEGRLHLVEENAPAEIVLDAYPKKRFRGKVTGIRPLVNRAKAAATVKVGFVDRVEGVLPNMAARVSFLRDAVKSDDLKAPRRLVVPESALLRQGNEAFVFVGDGDRLQKRKIVIGERFGRGFSVVEGPQAGTRIVDEPSEDLKDGSKIKEKNNG